MYSLFDCHLQGCSGFAGYFWLNTLDSFLEAELLKSDVYLQ